MACCLSGSTTMRTSFESEAWWTQRINVYQFSFSARRLNIHTLARFLTHRSGVADHLTDGHTQTAPPLRGRKFVTYILIQRGPTLHLFSSLWNNTHHALDLQSLLQEPPHLYTQSEWTNAMTFSRRSFLSHLAPGYSVWHGVRSQRWGHDVENITHRSVGSST